MAKKNEKREIREILNYDTNLELDVDGIISKLKSFKKEYTKKGYFNLFLDKEYDRYDDYMVHNLTGYRLETDEEFNKRIEKNKANTARAKKSAAKRKANKKKKELEIYKELYEKFEGKKIK
jgi:hypothetical protein